MSAGFDPYYTWLAIPPEEQPPHLYRLLGVKPLEENLDVIETAADRQMKHLRDFQSGKYAEACQKLLNEISAAKLTLLDPAKKAPYDAELRAKLSAAKQAEAKKIREERPLATAKPLATAAPLEPKLKAPSPAVQIGGPGGSPTSAAPHSGAQPHAASNIVPLIVIGVVALVLLAGGGLAAMMFLGNEKPAVAINTNPDGAAPIATPATADPATATPAPPIVPLVVPPPSNDRPAGETPAATEEPPAEDEPTTPEPPIDEPIADEPGDDEEPLAVAAEEPADEPPAKLAIPEKAAREAKRKEILTIFPIAQAKTFEQKGELAAQLISTAGETADDPAAVFAMLNLAREQAAEAGHIKLAFEATDMLGEKFDFDAAAVRIASLQQASRAQLPPAAKREIVIAGMDVIDELSAADKFDEADALCDRMLAVARPLRDAELIKQLAEQKRAVDDLASSYKKAEAAFATLKTSPDDADANLAAGEYLAFVKQDWKAGLAHLAKGSDATLAAAAKGELAAPESPADQEKLADAWWAAADVQKESVVKNYCRAQAGYWYREIVEKLSGLAKVKVEKRIADVGDLAVASTSSARPNRKVDLETVFLDDLQEADSKVGYGSLGKHGRKHDGQATTFGGEQLTHSLETHPVTRGTAYVTYDVDGKAEQFEAIAAIRDGSGAAASPLVFQVVGDGKILWQSPPMQRHNSAQPCRIKVRGIKALSLQVVCSGAMDEGNSLWINPRISRVKDEAAEPDLGVFSRDPAEAEKATVEILDATFGENAGRIVITDEVRRFATDPENLVTISTSGMGLKNPRAFVRKQLIVQYKLNGVDQTRVFNNGEQVNFYQALRIPQKTVSDDLASSDTRTPKAKKPNPKAFYNCVIGGYMNFHESKPIYPLLNLQVPNNNLWNDRYAAQLQNMVRDSLAYKGQARFFAPQDGDYDVQATNFGVEIDGVKLPGFRDAWNERVQLRKGLHTIVLNSHTHGQPHLQNASIKIIDAKTGDELPLVNLWADVQAALATPVGGVRVTEISGWQPDEEKIVPIKLK